MQWTCLLKLHGRRFGRLLCWDRPLSLEGLLTKAYGVVQQESLPESDVGVIALFSLCTYPKFCSYGRV